MYSSELVYLLDLSIFAYHLYSQTLVWPTDPYYEQLASWLNKYKKFGSRRSDFMANVHTNFFEEIRPNRPVRGFDGFDRTELHGPGNFAGKEDWLNKDLDPIFSKYKRINPWQPSFTRSSPGQWIVYNTPKEITYRINKVNFVRYKHQQGYYHAAPEVEIDILHENRPEEILTNIKPTDTLYCFEGGTGNIRATGGSKDDETSASWSMMGFVLAEQLDQNDNYNVFIAFRGSRSGRAKREASKTLLYEKGNPDWVTDTDLNNSVMDADINEYGRSARGFGASLKTIFPTLLKCLTEINTEKGKPPQQIYVTGHSLGGALATLFTSAMTCGEFGFEQNGNGRLKKANPLPNWPWKNIKLVTFGAPVVGDEDFADSLSAVDSQRCLLRGDPVTKPSAMGKRIGHHIGREMAIKSPTKRFDNHETYYTRRYLLQFLRKTGTVSLQNIPADSGEEEDLEPYKELPDLQSMIFHLKSIEQHLAPRQFTPRQIMPEFSGFYYLYLRMLYLGYFEKPGDFKSMMIELEDVIENQTESLMNKHLKTLEGHKDTVEKYFNKKMVVFFAINIYLAEVTKENTWLLPVPKILGKDLK